MSYTQGTPAKMSSEGARALPRFALWGLLLLFIINSLFLLTPWTLDDGLSLGLARTTEAAGWPGVLLPYMADVPVVTTGPLAHWLEGALLFFLPDTPDMIVQRFCTMIWYALALFGLWHRTWQLAVRPEAQPARFAFGDEAGPRAYARVIADCTVLLLIATFGTLQAFHERNASATVLALSCLSFYGSTLALTRPTLGFALAGAAAGTAALAGTVFSGLWLCLAALAVNFFVGNAYVGSPLRRAAVLIAAALVRFAGWPLAAHAFHPNAEAWFDAWWAHQAGTFGFFDWHSLTWIVTNFAWFLLPLWPLVFIGLYNWRHHLGRTHILIPLVYFVANAAMTLTSSDASVDNVFLLWIPTLAVLAAFSLNTIKKTRENILDWFSLSIFTLGTLTFWIYWLAWQTGFSEKMRHSVTRLRPNVTPVVDYAVVAALCLTLYWGVLVFWRLSHRPSVAWRGPWLAANGLTVVATVFIALFGSVLLANRSYQPVYEGLRGVLAASSETECIRLTAMPAGVYALLRYEGELPVTTRDDLHCRWTLERRNRNEDASIHPNGQRFRRVHTDEYFVLIDRTR